MPCSALPVHVPLAARADELLDHVRHIALRERPHLLRGKIANGVRQDYRRMSRHTFGAKLKYGGVGECLGDDDCGRDAALLECNRVVHTGVWHRLEDDITLFFRIVEEPHDFVRQVTRTSIKAATPTVGSIKSGAGVIRIAFPPQTS